MAITYLSGNRIQGLLGSVTPAILATTGWTLFNSDHIITGSDGIRLQSGSDGYSYYDFGASDGINTNDEWVCDFDILRAASNDYYDHPMISLRSVHGVHGNPANNGDCKILLMYWANGNTGNSNGATITNAYHKTSGSVTGVATEENYCHQTGATLYYRIYMSKSGDDTGKLRQSAWTSDAYRTAEGATGRVINNLSAATMTENGDWEAADDMRYLIVENSNGNEAWYTLKSFKFWNVASTGVADNMLSHTPTKSLTFNDVAAIPAPDEKATITNVPVGTRFEETDTRQIFRRKSAPSASDTLTTDTGWVATNSEFAHSTGKLTFDPIRRNTTAQHIYIDLQDSDWLGSGNNLSDTAWLVRLGKLKTTGFGGSGDSFLQLSLSSTTGDSGSTQDGVGLQISYAGEYAGNFQAQACNDGNFEGTNRVYSSFTLQNTASFDKYIEIKKTAASGSNNFTLSVFPDDTYDTADESVTLTQTCTSLRYIKFQNVSDQTNSNVTGSAELSGGIQVYNGVSTATNVESWVEKGTA